MPYRLRQQDPHPLLELMPGGDPPPHKPPLPPEQDDRNRHDEGDDIPDTPGSEPPPVPIRDPRPEGAPTGPVYRDVVPVAESQGHRVEESQGRKVAGSQSRGAQ